jgi:outer membrane lipoprotein-sorting protein
MRTDPRWPAALLLLAALQLSAAEEFGPAQLMLAFAAIPEARTRFTEVRRSDVLRAPLELKGKLHYQRPDRLERHVLSPYQEVTRIDGDRVTIENPARGEPRTYSLAALPAALALVEGLRATLAGDLAALERHYRVSLAGSREAWTLSLVPRTPAVAGAVSSIQLTGSAARLTRVEIEETSGDRITTVFGDR